MNTLDITIFRLGLGLLLLILANIALGSVAAIIERTFDWAKFRNGAIKGIVVIGALVAVYFAGYLNPDLLVIETGDEAVNLMTAIYIMMLAAFAVYAVDVLKKLKDMLTTPTPGSDKYITEGAAVEDEVVEVDVEVEAGDESELEDAETRSGQPPDNDASEDLAQHE